ncbi:hypothetical protein [Streptomyces sp. NPDC057623]|uniref:hypothetical protein n=1 Tax=Streptomyces sp. NPDC057623 TaxID=3346187 RepID=UPI00367885C2
MADAEVQPQDGRRYFSARLDEEGEDINRMVHDLAERAVHFLELSSRNQDSGFASSIRPWLLADDPDLIGLRRRAEFIRWAEQHYPDRYPNRLRPDNVHEIELLYYEQLFIERSAAMAACVWKHRSAQGSNGGLSAEQLREWLEDEEKWWDLVGKFVDNRRHWQTRCEAIREMREFGHNGASSGMAYEFTVPYPVYSSDPIIHLPASGDDEFIEKVEEAQRQRNGRVEDLWKILKCRQEWCLVDVPSSSSPSGIPRFCDQLAARWDMLAKSFREEMAHDELKPLASVQKVGRRPGVF